MSTVVTLTELVEAIRSARTVEDLQALQRMVGPSAREQEEANARLAELDRLGPRCKWGEMLPRDADVLRARERWQVIMAVQGQYENRFL